MFRAAKAARAAPQQQEQQPAPGKQRQRGIAFGTGVGDEDDTYGMVRSLWFFGVCLLNTIRDRVWQAAAKAFRIEDDTYGRVSAANAIMQFAGPIGPPIACQRQCSVACGTGFGDGNDTCGMVHLNSPICNCSCVALQPLEDLHCAASSLLLILMHRWCSLGG